MVLVWAGLAMLSSVVQADVQLTFPLGGYYHPGRYMPVHVRVNMPELGHQADQRIYVFSHSGMHSELVFGDGKTDVTIPYLFFLPTEKPLTARVIAKKFNAVDFQDVQPLRPLESGQKLVAFATGDGPSAAAAANLASGDAAWISVELDRAHPLDGPPAAWEGLDAVVLDPAALISKQVDEQKLAVLVAAGTAVLVRDPEGQQPSAKPPFLSNWPWTRLEVPGEKGGPVIGYWKIQLTPAGPATFAFNSDVFRPVLGKDNSWSLDYRKQIVIYGAIFSALIVMLALWKPRGAVVMVVIVCAGLCGFQFLWYRMQTALVGRGGSVFVTHGPLVQTDAWSFQSTVADIGSTLRWGDVTKPIFPREFDFHESSIVLRCNPSGDPHEFYLWLPTGGQMILWSRSVGPAKLNGAPSQPIRSPLMPIIRDLYLKAGDDLQGEFEWTPPLGPTWQSAERWPAVVVRRAP